MTAPVVPLLTGTQQRILAFIRSYAAEKKFPPTLREISAEVGLVYSAVSYQIGQLDEMGWIRRVPGSPRTLVVLDPKTGGE